MRQRSFPVSTRSASGASLVLQLRIVLAFVMGDCGSGLAASSPERPDEDEGRSGWWPEDEAGQQGADLGHAREESMAQVDRRRSAARRARKAAAAMTRLI